MLADDVLILAKAALDGRSADAGAIIEQMAQYEAKQGRRKVASRLRTLRTARPIPSPPQLPPKTPRATMTRSKPTRQEGTWPAIMPSENFNQVILEKGVKERLERLAKDIQNTDQLLAWGIDEAPRILLHGPPGTGKTLSAHAIANHAGRPVISVQLDQVMSSFLGETAKNVSQAFEQATEIGAILFLDEVDALIKSRDDKHDVGELKRTVNSILQLLDASSKELVVIAATNHEDIIDDAAWRRFSDIIHIPAPDAEIRQEIIELYLAKTPSKLTKYHTELLSLLTIGLTGSDIKRFIRNAARNAMHRNASAIEDEDVFESLRYTHKMMGLDELDLDELEEMSKIAELSQKGVNQRKIADQIGVSPTTVNRRLKKIRTRGLHGRKRPHPNS